MSTFLKGRKATQRLPAIDGANLTATIQRALASAGLMRHAGVPAESSESSALVAGAQGQFLSRTYSNPAGTRRYKLYIPTSYTGTPVPLIVMLHGCTQDPDDFAAGTRMNEWAEKECFLVIYPAQSANANGAKCWNWFDPEHQAPDRGEPSLIAGITREVAAAYAVDAKRVFIGGLSAGAAMAVVLGATHPDLFAGVAAHSGLPYGAAHDVPSALAAMRASGEQIAGRQRAGPGAPKSHADLRPTPRTIVFHGDRDTTVHIANGSAIVSRAVESAEESGRTLARSMQKGQSAVDRHHTTTVYRDSTMRPHIEEWVLHGAGHAWSGGSSAGSYTDVNGPDASAGMLRFFLA